jgi:hypothetical protein
MPCAIFTACLRSTWAISVVVKHQERGSAPVISVVVDPSVAKLLIVCAESHKEGTVLFILKVNFSLQCWCPLFAFITPSAFIFTLSPWISDLDEFDFVAESHNFDD